MKYCWYFFLLFILTACSSSEVEDAELVQINPEFAKYVSAFTGGTIPSDGTIKVQFIEPVDADKRDGNMSSVFRVYPEVDGEVTWLDDQTIEFKPTELLSSGIRYKGSINLAELMTVQAGLENFEFNFRTVKKDLRVDIEQFATYNAADYTKQKLNGKIRFTDVVDSAKVKNIITATQDGKELFVSIKKENKFAYQFTVENILRKDKRSDLELKWNGEAVGVDKSEVKK